MGIPSVRKRTQRLDWDGLRYFHAVASKGTLTGAAHALRVQHTTVARQLDALEATLGARLFLRNPRGYVLTRLGETLLDSVGAIEARVADVARLVAGEDPEEAGNVRIATADILATHILTPALAPALAAQPNLTIEIVSDTRSHDLTRREADLALRIGGAETDAHLLVRKVARLGFGVYAARGSTKRLDFRKARYVAFDESVGSRPHDEWLAANAPDAQIVFRSNRQHTLIEAVRAGIGIGILPCIAADGDRDLTELLGPKDVFWRDLSVLVHPDLRHARRIHLVIDALERHIVQEGRRGYGPP